MMLIYFSSHKVQKYIDEIHLFTEQFIFIHNRHLWYANQRSQIPESITLIGQLLYKGPNALENRH